GSFLREARNSCSAVFRSPFWRNAQPRSALMAAAVCVRSGGIDGFTKSGNFGVVTTGAGMIFGAQALATTAASVTLTTATRSVRSFALSTISESLLRNSVGLASSIELAHEPARNVCDDRHPVLARLVLEDATVTVETRDPLAILFAVGVEGQRHP